MPDFVENKPMATVRTSKGVYTKALFEPISIICRGRCLKKREKALLYILDFSKDILNQFFDLSKLIPCIESVMTDKF